MDNRTNKMLGSNKKQLTKVQTVSNPKKQNLANNSKNPVAMKVSSNSPASIIKIVPNNPKKLNKVPLPQNCMVKTFIVTRPNSKEPQTSPSTSKATGDHEYVCKNENPEDLENIVYFDESQEVTEEDIDEDSHAEQSNHNHLKRHIEHDVMEIPEKISKVHSENCCCACRDTLETILQKQNQILNYLKSAPPNAFRELKFDLLPPMPFNDLNDFLDFDESLVNENVVDQLIAKLQRLLVTIDKKSVTNIMSSLMTNELCKKISWIGIKDSIAFQNTNMVNHIIDVILDHHGLDIDIIKGYLAEWLRRCSDRIASEVRKNKKKAQQLGFEDT